METYQVLLIVYIISTFKTCSCSSETISFPLNKNYGSSMTVSRVDRADSSNKVHGPSSIKIRHPSKDVPTANNVIASDNTRINDIPSIQTEDNEDLPTANNVIAIDTTRINDIPSIQTEDNEDLPTDNNVIASDTTRINDIPSIQTEDNEAMQVSSRNEDYVRVGEETLGHIVKPVEYLVGLSKVKLNEALRKSIVNIQ